VFHLVGGRFSLDPFDRTGPAGNRLVLIGRNLDRARLRAQLDNWTRAWRRFRLPSRIPLGRVGAVALL
jgi:hypothetical protein